MAHRVPDRIATPLRQIHTNLERCVRIDTRSLAVFRIFVGLLMVADILLRSRNFAFYYTDDGVVTQEMAEQATADTAFSVFYFTSDPTIIALLFVVHFLVAIQLIVGYRTRLAIVVSFLFVISLDHHNPLVLSYADTLFRLLLFWAIFLPLGERWSVDAVRASSSPRTYFSGLASAMIMLQMVQMYFINGYHKTEEELWTGGEAAPLVLGLDDMTFLLAPLVRQVPELLMVGGLIWFYILLLSWLLIVLQGPPRYVLLALFAGGHLSFAITVRIGAFAFVALAGLLTFVQTDLWRAGRHVAVDHNPLGERLWDGYQRARQGGIAVATRFPYGTFDEDRFRETKATVYTIVIYMAAAALAVSLLFTYIPLSGAVGETHDPHEPIDDVKAIVGADQPTWSIFAPTPRTTDRYYVFPAMTAEGEKLDVYNDRPLTFERPEHDLQDQYGTYRERFYMNSIRRGFPHDARDELVDHLCETWEEEHGVELTNINMYEVRENIEWETIADMDERDQTVRQISEHGCGDNEPRTIGEPDI